jgi:hypothetical protein
MTKRRARRAVIAVVVLAALGTGAGAWMRWCRETFAARTTTLDTQMEESEVLRVDRRLKSKEIWMSLTGVRRECGGTLMYTDWTVDVYDSRRSGEISDSDRAALLGVATRYFNENAAVRNRAGVRGELKAHTVREYEWANCARIALREGLPVLAFVGPVAAAGIAGIAALSRTSRAERRGVCSECGYSLAGLTGRVCPECGRARKRLAGSEDAGGGAGAPR